MEKYILYRLSTKKQDNSNYLSQKFLREMPDKEGHIKTYMPYGIYGRGFYYKLNVDKK